ncbi:uncharacterized protein [Nicotiana tomentosiformis]|uniref:uncharacterized protein n=1 Tax=Nicotiana tomentosiformis TaxID=4098 RepID=UPI00388C9ECA
MHNATTVWYSFFLLSVFSGFIMTRFLTWIFASHGNLFASKGLQKLILDKKNLTSKLDQLLAERDQVVARLLALEAQAAEASELEAQLQLSEQEVVVLSQEASQLSVQFQESKAKWCEIQNVIVVSAEHEAASTERLNNLEEALNSKAEEADAAEEKHAQMEEKYKRVMEHSKLHMTTIRDLDLSLRATRSETESLSTEVDQLKLELQHRADSAIIEKSYSTYNMRRKTLEEDIMGIIDFHAEIAKA